MVLVENVLFPISNTKRSYLVGIVERTAAQEKHSEEIRILSKMIYSTYVV